VSGWRVTFRWRFTSGGFDILQGTLIGLKLGGVVTWPWSLVLLPLWFGLGALFIIGLGIAVILAGRGLSMLMEHRKAD
jgi:hypothetical protein